MLGHDCIYLNLFYGMLGSSNSKPGYSSVGRASDCRLLQQSDGPWFDSGWPDLRPATVMLRSLFARTLDARLCPRGWPLVCSCMAPRMRLEVWNIAVSAAANPNCWGALMTRPSAMSCAVPYVSFESSWLCGNGDFREEGAAKDEVRIVRPRASRVFIFKNAGEWLGPK